MNLQVYHKKKVYTYGLLLAIKNQFVINVNRSF